MMKSVVLAALVIGANAFAPAQQSQGIATRLAASADLEGLRGVDIESGKKIFDPLGLAEYGSVDYLRKAELSNGRSAMLATVGWIFPKLFFTFDGPVDTVDPIAAISASSPQWWAQFIFFCGVIEGIKYRAEQEGKSYTADGAAAIDWANQWEKLSPEKKESIALSELKNGRLAMLGFAGFVANYFIPGSVPGTPDFI